MPHNQDNAHGPKLTDDQRRFCVFCFAHWKTPQQTADLLEESHGVKITRQAARVYSPKLNPKIAEKWRAIHDAERKRFVEEVDGIAIAHLSYRLEMLDTIATKAIVAGDTATALAALEQAAKDKGGVFTSSRNLSVDGGFRIEAFLTAAALNDLDDQDNHKPRNLQAVKGAAA